MRSTWIVRHAPDGSDPCDLIERVLRSRGIIGASEQDAEHAQAFLMPRLSSLHNPSLIPDLDRAASRLLEALSANERIVIYGDYDADGITAAAILFHILMHLGERLGLGRDGANVRTYVPHRLEEGYGLNAEAIATLAGEGAKVIVSVDCGITSIGPAQRAKACGVDLIITDHHNPPASTTDLPDAYAVVHPRRPDSTYPFGELCGAGVAYKLAWRLATMGASMGREPAAAFATPTDEAVSSRVDPATRELLVDLLAYAALGTVADIVPLVGENRVIARFGLSRLRHVGSAGVNAKRFRGIQALIDASGLSGEAIGAVDVGFKLAPRLNAAGRLGHARSAVELLTTADDARASEIAIELSKQNDQRRAVEREIFEQACERAEAAGMTAPGRHAIVLADERWHQGVVGIVCSRLVERYRRPTILMNASSGVCQGSGRSIDGFSLHDALARFSAMFDRFGGHDMAAGLALRAERLDEFAAAFIDFASGAITAEQMTPRLRVDCDAQVHELSAESIGRLERVGPFGRENPSVRVRLRGVRLAMPPKTMGVNARHLSMLIGPPPTTPAARVSERGVSGQKASRELLRVVGWNWGESAASFQPGRLMDVVIEPRLSTWNGVTRVEGELCDAMMT